MKQVFFAFCSFWHADYARRGTLLAGLWIIMSACQSVGSLGQLSQESVHGYVITQDTISQISEGASEDEVLIALGTPSTTGTLDGKAYYYISQRKKKTLKFLKGNVIEQEILAVYFDTGGTVDRIAHYGLKDGKTFDFITKTTPTGGKDVSFIGQMLAGLGRGL